MYVQAMCDYLECTVHKCFWTDLTDNPTSDSWKQLPRKQDLI